MDSPLAERRLLVTGGAGFIGSAFVIHALAEHADRVVVLDALTYAGNLDNLESVAHDPRLTFVRGDIADRALVGSILADLSPHGLVHLAAASHVDRSIAEPDTFVDTNVHGTLALLEAVRAWWRPADTGFRYVQVSTDEVYGPLPPPVRATEDAPIRPSSPYAASKAGGDALVHAWHVTWGLPTLITLGANTYGPRQFPEKLVPRFLNHGLQGRTLPIYGDGLHVREWLHVADHAAGIAAVLTRGTPGGRYNLAADIARTNLELVASLCLALDAVHPEGAPHADLRRFVADRPGHDRRYALDGARTRALGWTPRIPLEAGLLETARWYAENPRWLDRVASGAYRHRTILEAS